MLSRDELVQFQALAQRLQLLAPPSTASGSLPTPDTLTGNNAPPQERHMGAPTEPIPTQPMATGNPIQHYNSVRLSQSSLPAATQGHPSSSLSANSLPRPFLLPGPASSGHPSASVSAAATSSSQPFLGFNNLAIPMTSQANQRRLSAAAAHIPRPQRLPSRGRRRGPAVAAPGLPRAPRIDDCLISVGDGTEPGIRLKIKVYPPLVQTADHIFLYKAFRDSFNAKLESYDLLYNYELPLTLAVSDIINRVSADMQSCQYNYQFTVNPYTFLLSHEGLPLQLLEFVNRGIPRPDGQVRLRRVAHGQLTLGEVATDRAHYAIPSLAIEGNHLVLHFVVRIFPLLAMGALGASDATARVHSCVSHKVYSLFGHDGIFGNPSYEHGDTSDDDSSAAPIAAPPISALSSIHAPSSNVAPAIQSSSSSGTAHAPSAVQRHPSLSSYSFLPPCIWITPWVASVGPYNGLFSMEMLAERVYAVATSGHEVGILEVRGTDTTEMAMTFGRMLGDAAAAGDFTDILSPDRSFIVVSQDENGDEVVRSLGEGVEREVIHMAFEKFRANDAQWFSPRADGHSTLATSLSISTARHTPPSRLRDLWVLGAVTALCLIHGMPTLPWDPVFLHYFIHDCEIASITEEMLSEWHPELKRTLSKWLEIGPQGDISEFRDHFASYHDMQVACLRDRDEASHNALASDMLYRSIIGTEPPNHPELRAFQQGFRLPCRNGFSFFDIIKSLNGGSDKFFKSVWSTHISSYDTLAVHMRIQDAPSIFGIELQVVLRGSDDHGATFKSLLTTFLRGSGIPSPSLFASVRDHFNPIIDLSTVDDEGFRARMFCWASTGSCERALDAPPIMVRFVDDNDPAYGNNDVRQPMIREGKINFKTCFSKALVPASYLIRLARNNLQSSSDVSGVSSFRNAVDHWLLCETLNAIGNHTVA